MRIPIKIPAETLFLEKGDYFWETPTDSSLKITLGGIDFTETSKAITTTVVAKTKIKVIKQE